MSLLGILPRKLVFVKETKEDIAKLAHPSLLHILAMWSVFMIFAVIAIIATFALVAYLNLPYVAGIPILILMLAVIILLMRRYGLFPLKY